MGKKKKTVEEPKVVEMKPEGHYLRANGVIFLNGSFDKETIAPITQRITEYNLMDEEAPKEIKLIINSPGGEVRWCWQLVDAIKMSDIPIVTIGQGMVASCGVLTLMSGTKRFVTHNTSVMSHVYSWGSKGKEGELMAMVKEFEMSSERMLEHYKKCTGKSKRYIRKHLLHNLDEWLTPEECIEHGIVDEIWTTY